MKLTKRPLEYFILLYFLVDSQNIFGTVISEQSFKFLKGWSFAYIENHNLIELSFTMFP